MGWTGRRREKKISTMEGSSPDGEKRKTPHNLIKDIGEILGVFWEFLLETKVNINPTNHQKSFKSL